MLRRLVCAATAVAVAGLGLVALPAPAAPAPGIGRNIEHVANIPWGGNEGTDLELTTIGGRDYAVAGSYDDGLRIVDVTAPTAPVLVSTYPCGIAQGDVQIFRRDGRVLVAYTADDGYGADTDSACYRDADVEEDVRYGTFFIDISDVRSPRAVAFVEVPQGSHNTTVHPGGRYLYNSNADLEDPSGIVEIVDVGDVRQPQLIGAVDLRTGLSSHDITFSRDGSRAYVAALTHTLILDTTDPASPSVIGRILDPAMNIHHGAEPFTLTDAGGAPHTYLILSDELAGAAGNGFCPGGGLHVYEITGALERAPVKIGAYFIPEFRATDGESIACTSHVMQVHETEQLMTIAWYAAGVHVLDLSGLGAGRFSPRPGETLGAGIRQVGSYRFPDSDTWAAKTNRIAADGSFYLYGNDVIRGFDVYRYVPSPRGSFSPLDDGRWLPPSPMAPAVRAEVSAPRCLVPLDTVAT